MKYKYKIYRCVALFMALNMLQWTLFPTISWALTQPGTQPEFSSYESVDNTDMINLMTGDFTYNVPVLSIPGPEGSFTMPLSYHAGVGPEQESSWVGLGWSMNPGAISRQLNQYPDDAKGTYTYSTGVGNDFMKVSNTGTGASFWEDNYLLYHRNWDSEHGKGGSISLLGYITIGWGNQSSFDVLGLVGADRDGFHALGVTIGGGKVTADVMGIANSAFTILTMAAAPAEAAMNSTAKEAGSALERTFANLMEKVGAPLLFAAMAPGTEYSQGYMGWHLHTWKRKQRTHGIYYLDQSRVEVMFGSLYLGDMPAGNPAGPLNSGTTSAPGPQCSIFKYDHYNATDGDHSIYWGTDMYSYLDNTDYSLNVEPTHLAYDNYSVMGPGIAGNIHPYRQETGSVVFPRAMQFNDIWKYNLVPFLPNSVANAAYKVNFRYDSEFGNHYDYQKGTPTDPDNFGVDVSSNTNSVYYNINDQTLTDPTKRIEQDRYGLQNHRLINGRHVEWFTNTEISSGTPIQQGKLMDFLSGTARTNFRSGTNAPDGIGGYAVTAEDGTTYHYALPVYNKIQFGRTSNNGIVSDMTMGSPYAITWLLTGITGPDFVDKGTTPGVIDDKDWGYWVKFDYGKFASKYHWRSPYWYYDTPDNTGNYSYSEGLKETYYLNTIRTRTHTAIFVKEIKQDGRGAYARNGNASDPSTYTLTTLNNHNDLNPSSALRLNEIILVTNQTYDFMNGTYLLLNGNTNDPNGNYSVNGDTYDNVYDIYDINAARTYLNGNQLRRIVFNYDYTYCLNTHNAFQSAASLPVGGPNVGTGSAKLTLNSVSVFGKNNVRLFPDYSFTYGNDKPYDAYTYDGWGMYKQDGTNNRDNHRTKSTNAVDGTAWSLTKITTPLGGTIQIDYERDSYSSVCGEPVKVKIPLQTPVSNSDWRIYTDNSFIEDNLSSIISNGDVVTLNAVIIQSCEHKDHCLDLAVNWAPTIRPYAYTADQVVSQLSGNSFVLSNPPPLPQGDSCCSAGGCTLRNCSVASIAGTITAQLKEVKGGDIRVSKITSSDGTNTYFTRYIYTKDGLATGVSSGVVAKEPPPINSVPHSQDNSYDYPFTPVLYGKVTVLSGVLSTDADYTEKMEYNFETPKVDFVTMSSNAYPYDLFRLSDLSSGFKPAYLRKYKFVIDNKSNHIGRLNSIKKFDKNNTLMHQTTFNYKDSDYQGIFYEGSLLAEWMTHTGAPDYYYKLFRTEKHYIPSYLSSVTITDKGISTTTNNTAFDFFTGEVVEKKITNSLGINYTSVAVPAYQIYPEMGFKALNPANKNMLSQNAASYTFKPSTGTVIAAACSVTTIAGSPNMYQVQITDANKIPSNYGLDFGPSVVFQGIPNAVKVTYISKDRKTMNISTTQSVAGTRTLSLYPSPVTQASVQTWNNSWSIRNYDATTREYSNSAPIADDPSTTTVDERVWRKSASYVWNSNSVNTDGSYQNFSDIDWSLASALTPQSSWQRINTVNMYDEYSKPLQSMDVNGNYVATKYGYDRSNALFSVKNANYTELAYSGAEDINPTTNFSGGEVDNKDGQWDVSKFHTGGRSLRVNASTTNNKGFLYRGLIDDGMIGYGKTYRASVWVYDNGNTNARLYWKILDKDGVTDINVGGNTTIGTSSTVITAGNWKLLSLDIPVGATYQKYHLVVGCENADASATAYFDDFRFHPLNTSMTCNVYDPNSGMVTHVLDGDGFYIRYEYDDHDRIKAVYKETIAGEKKQEEYYYNYGRGNN